MPEQTKQGPASHRKELVFVTFHFSLRTREFKLASAKLSLLQKDQSGAEFFSLGTDSCAENSQGGLKGGESKASVGRIQDAQQLKAIKLLRSKLNPACDRPFQHAKPSVNAEGPTWFVAAPLGKITLSNMMPRISEKAGLSQRCTITLYMPRRSLGCLMQALKHVIPWQSPGIEASRACRATPLQPAPWQGCHFLDPAKRNSKAFQPGGKRQILSNSAKSTQENNTGSWKNPGVIIWAYVWSDIGMEMVVR